MEGLRNTPGFLGTGANILADINLVVQILFYVVLCLGVVAQLRKQYKWHDRLQTPVVLLNLLFILLVMIPSFMSILPQLPARFGEPAFMIPTLHAVLGLLAEGIAIYCFLAGVRILPRNIGILRYWMWTAFVLWTLTILFGLGIYLTWYTGSAASSGEPQAEHQADLVAEHDAVLETPTVEVMQEHAEEPVAVEPIPTEPPVAEHAEELIVTEEPTQTPTSTPTQTPVPPTATPSPSPTATAAPARVGLVTFSDKAARSDQVSLTILAVSPPPEGSVYEAWLAGDDPSPLSLGQLTVADEAINHTFTDPAGRNLLALFHRAFITLEPVNDSDPASSEAVVFAGELPPAAAESVRLIAAIAPDTPNGNGLGLNTLAEATALLKIAEVQPGYVSGNDLVNLKVHAEAALNLLEGAGSPDYGDRDGDGEVFNPGDGLGLLNKTGYLAKIVEQAAQAGQTANAGELIKLHAGHVQVSAENMLDWAAQIQALEQKLLQAPDATSAAPDTAKVLELTQAMLEGVDTNNDGRVDPIPGEGGARTLYEHAQLMGGIELLTVQPQPAAAPATAPTTEPTATPRPVEPTATSSPVPTATPELIDEHAAEPASEHDGN